MNDMDAFCLYGAAGILVVSAALVLLRTVLGPNTLDRSIGLDTLTAICLAAIAVDAAQRAASRAAAAGAVSLTARSPKRDASAAGPQRGRPECPSLLARSRRGARLHGARPYRSGERRK